MAYTQRPTEVRITSRTRDWSRRWTVKHAGFGPQRSLPATQVEIVRLTKTYAPINARGARQPGTSDTEHYEVLHTLSVGEAARLAQSLISSVTSAAPYVPEGQGYDIEAEWGPVPEDAPADPEVAHDGPAVQDLSDLDR